MHKCNMHTILRLSTGIFYAQGVKTNVLFLQRGTPEKGNTKQVWFYDLRTNIPVFGKRTPLTREHFRAFKEVYGDDVIMGEVRVLTKDNWDAGAALSGMEVCSRGIFTGT